MSSSSSDSESSLGLNPASSIEHTHRIIIYEDKDTSNKDYYDNSSESQADKARLLPKKVIFPEYTPQNPPSNVYSLPPPLPILNKFPKNDASAVRNLPQINPPGITAMKVPPNPSIPPPSQNFRPLPSPIPQYINPESSDAVIDSNLPPSILLYKLPPNRVPPNPPRERVPRFMPAITKPGSSDFPDPPSKNPDSNSNQSEFINRTRRIDIDYFLNYPIANFEYKGCWRCCMALETRILQLYYNRNLNIVPVNNLKEKLQSVNVTITEPSNIIYLSILIHCLKLQTYEIRALRMNNMVDRLYKVVVKSSDYFIQHLRLIRERSVRWGEMKSTFKPIICLNSGLVLKAIQSNTGVDIQESKFNDESELFLANPDSFWSDI